MIFEIWSLKKTIDFSIRLEIRYNPLSSTLVLVQDTSVDWVV